MDDHQIKELLENLEAWGEEFRTNQHGATLTILRARKTITDQVALIAQLKVAGVELVETARRNLPRVHPTIERNAKLFIPENADWGHPLAPVYLPENSKLSQPNPE